jgi:hypothetical protein
MMPAMCLMQGNKTPNVTYAFAEMQVKIVQEFCESASPQ